LKFTGTSGVLERLKAWNRILFEIGKMIKKTKKMVYKGTEFETKINDSVKDLNTIRMRNINNPLAMSELHNMFLESKIYYSSRIPKKLLDYKFLTQVKQIGAYNTDLYNFVNKPIPKPLFISWINEIREENKKYYSEKRGENKKNDINVGQINNLETVNPLVIETNTIETESISFEEKLTLIQLLAQSNNIDLIKKMNLVV